MGQQRMIKDPNYVLVLFVVFFVLFKISFIIYSKSRVHFLSFYILTHHLGFLCFGGRVILVFMKKKNQFWNPLKK